MQQPPAHDTTDRRGQEAPDGFKARNTVPPSHRYPTQMPRLDRQRVKKKGPEDISGTQQQKGRVYEPR
jgi:hypothetical protein